MTTVMPPDSVMDDVPQRPKASEWLAFGLMLLAHAPLLYVYLQQLWDRPHYQFFPLVLFAFGALSVSRWSERRIPTRRAVVLSRLLLLLSAGLLTLAIARLSPLGGYVSFAIVVGSLLLRFGVPAWGPWLLLCLMLRIPYGYDVATIQTMQRITTDLSGTALDTIGVEFFSEGNVLVFPTQSLFVEEACSGIVSMLAMIACAGIMAAWWRRSAAHALVLMASGIFWAGAMNVIRVVAIAIMLARYNIDLTEGWRHAMVGLFAFAISLGALYSTDRLLLFLMARIKMNPLASYFPYAEENWLVWVWNFCVGRGNAGELDESYGDHAEDWENPTDEVEPVPVTPAAGSRPAAPRPWEWAIVPLFLVLGAAQVYAGIGPFSVAPDVRTAALNVSEDDLPGEFHGWTRLNFETQERDSSSAFGEHSRIWTYRRGRIVAQLSLDFVFPEWHELTACYKGTGWTIESRSRLASDSTAVQAEFTKPNGEHAFLIFDLFDSQGDDYLAPDGSFLHPQLRRILKGDVNRFTLPSYYQVQLLAGVPDGVLSPEDQHSLHQLFRAFEEQMRAMFTPGSPHPEN